MGLYKGDGMRILNIEGKTFYNMDEIIKIEDTPTRTTCIIFFKNGKKMEVYGTAFDIICESSELYPLSFKKVKNPIRSLFGYERVDNWI